jgi:hypothetical protein
MNNVVGSNIHTKLSGADYAHMIFRAAKTHAAGANIIMDSEGVKGLGLPALPVVVLSALAAELFLKAALVLEGATMPRGHNLYELLKSLSGNAQEKILLRNFERSGSSSEETLGRLKSEGNAFVDWRYVFEFYELRTIPLLHFEFAISVHDYLVELHPSWQAVEQDVR